MSTPVDVCAPAEESEGTRSHVLRWLKAPGDAVVRDEPLIELETDKVTVEVPSPADGVLREILKQEQDEVAPGDRLGRIDVAADRPAAVAAARPTERPMPGLPLGTASAVETAMTSAGLMSPAVRRLLAEHHVRPEDLTGSGAGGRITADDVLARVAARTAARPPSPAGCNPAAKPGNIRSRRARFCA